MSIEDCVRNYKNLAQVEMAFRTMKVIDLRVRPIYHYLDDRIKSHLFLTMLSYYVEWHMRKAWVDLTFADPEVAEQRKVRHPIRSAQRSRKCIEKVSSKMADHTLGIKAQSFSLLLADLGSISEVMLVLRKRGRKGKDIPFVRRQELSPQQKKAFKFIENFPMYPPLE
jgi:hypothetical protein